MGLIHGAYDAKAEGFAPGGLSLHNLMSGHGPDVDSWRKASEAELEAGQDRRDDGIHGRDLLALSPDRNSRSTARSPIMTRPGPDFPRRSCRDRRKQRSGPTSWVASASGSDFPIQNLPLGIFSEAKRRRRPGVAIGDYVLDLLGNRRPARRGLARRLVAAGAQCLAGARAGGRSASFGCACANCCPTNAIATTSSRTSSATAKYGCTCRA